MFTIRTAQRDELGRVAFESAVLEHVTTFFPRHVAALGPAETRKAIRAARAGAVRQGFEGEREIAHFIDLTFMFGPGFPEAPWAARILADRRTVEAHARMARLYDAAIEHLRSLSVLP
ncbi:Hypothetical protein A7982_06383 [Minicystis rosea]|nr:Hypothetical protein A7982_06383 [Minicystis rosea]